MDYLKEYRNFLYSHQLAEGIRITIGVALPALLFGLNNNIATGIMVSLGALSVGLTDTPGPIHHRRNGMIACNILIFLVSLVTGITDSFPVLMGFIIFVFCFIFSMIGVFGSRATSIGVACLLVMVLNIDRHHEGWQVLLNAINILAGGIWYTILSLLIFSFRPYKLIQQALGDCIQLTGDYMRIKASFYDSNVDYEKSYHQLLESQVAVHEKQDLIRDLLFKSRNIVKESTDTSRVLVMIFLDMVDLFERVITSQQDYLTLHKSFDRSGILEKFKQAIIFSANQADEIGIALKIGKPSESDSKLLTTMRELREQFERFRDENRNAENIEGFISLRQILESLQDIADRLQNLHLYTTYDQPLTGKKNTQVDYEKFISHQDISYKLLLDNFSFRSNIFRHALRVSIATICGYVISKFLPFGHSYWVLLTIIVILKPAYSLTKKRNYERLFGTIAGALIGIIILYFVKDKNAIFFIIIFLMIGTYSFMRTKYLISVILMTPYIILLFQLLNPGNFRVIISDRIIDTGIGSAIAFIANLMIVPAWEHVQITNYMVEVLSGNIEYLKQTISFAGQKSAEVSVYKLARKNAFVALANLSDAFSRMLSEPRRQQKNIKTIHQFVVTNHMLTSHIATLSYYLQEFQIIPEQQMKNSDYSNIVNIIIRILDHATNTIRSGSGLKLSIGEREPLRKLNEQVNILLEQRKLELKQGHTESKTKKELGELKSIADQFNYLFNVAVDIEKLSNAIMAA